jgi:hypothetical protein
VHGQGIGVRSKSDSVPGEPLCLLRLALPSEDLRPRSAQENLGRNFLLRGGRLTELRQLIGVLVPPLGVERASEQRRDGR